MNAPLDNGRRSAAWARGLLYAAAFSALVPPVAALGARAGWWSFAAGLKVLGAMAIGSSLLVLGGFATLVACKRPLERKLVTLAIMTALVPAIIIDTQIVRALTKPLIHDVSTDTADPPQFFSADIRTASRMNDLAYAGEETARQQASAYPDLRSLYSQLAPRSAFEIAGRTAEDLGWDIVLEDAERTRLEAVDTSFWFGFRDDISIRIRPFDSGSIIDVRSVSRVGESDVGANAARIRRFTHSFINQP